MVAGPRLTLESLRGAWALVTGASSGIGAEYCAQLAAAGAHLVLVARRRDRMEALADELGRRHGTRALVVELDLRDASAPDNLSRLLSARGVRIKLLVNNAAFGHWGRFEDLPAGDHEAMVRVNLQSVVACATRFSLISRDIAERSDQCGLAGGLPAGAIHGDLRGHKSIHPQLQPGAAR